MCLRWSASLLPLLGSFVVLAVSAVSVELCAETSCQQPQDNIRHAALMQRKKERHVVAPSERDAGPGTVRLFLSEMEGLAQRKGIDGLDPEEVQHVQTIKGLIADTIIPSILEGAEESKEEIAELYEAVLNCTQRATDELGVESTMHTEVEQHRDDHKECRKLEDATIKEKDRACQQFNITRTSIELPSGEMPGLDADHATMIQYLKDMNDYFCGRMQVFKDEWDECEELTKNYTDIHDHCVTLQQDLEESWCTWMTELDVTCGEEGGMSECWQSTITRFNERKTEIEQLVEDRKEALAAALKVQCLWDAWEWDHEPCTVNETKVKECKDLTPNTTDIEVDIPSPPHRHPCNMSAEGVFPCDEAFIASEYATLGVSEALVAEMKDACSACPPRPTGAPVAPRAPDLWQVEHVGGITYSAGPSTEGYLRMESVTGMTIRMLDDMSWPFIISFDPLPVLGVTLNLRYGHLTIGVPAMGTQQFPGIKLKDVISFEFTGEKYELKVNEEVVFETPFQYHGNGFLTMVQFPNNYPDRSIQAEFTFKTADVTPVLHHYGVEEIGTSSYRTKVASSSSIQNPAFFGGVFEAQDVTGVSFQSSAREWSMFALAGDWQTVEVKLQKGPVVSALLGQKLVWGQWITTDGWKASDVWDVRLSGTTVIVKVNNIEATTVELLSVPPTGFRFFRVSVHGIGEEADVSFDFARGS